MNKKICLGLFIGITISLLVVPVFADFVINTGPPVKLKSPKQWKTEFNVTNNGTTKDEAVYDVHFTIGNVAIITASRPIGWHSKLEGRIGGDAHEVTWTTRDKPIPFGKSLEGFDIVTDGPKYQVDWETTNKSGGIHDSGNFKVGS